MSLKDPSYDPFRRSDRYGTGGSVPQPLSEKLFLGLLSVFVLPFKVAGALSCLTTFYLFCRASILIPKQHRGDAVAQAGKIACRSCLFCLGFIHVRWQQLGKVQREPYVVVSNHSSWVDILVHMSRFFPAFVARDKTKDLLMIGLISKMMGCLFVDRERIKTNGCNQGVGAIVKERISRAANGKASSERPLLLFPEGTTTNGRYLLPFKSGAFLAGVPVSPVILQYGQGRVSPSWESINALQHVWLILSIPFHSVTAYELPVYVPTKEEIEDPLLYASNVRQYMLKYGKHLKASESGLAQKRAFHELLKAKTSL